MVDSDGHLHRRRRGSSTLKRVPSRWRSPLGRVISRPNVRDFMQRLGRELGYDLSLSTAYDWLSGRCRPSRRHAEAIQRVAGDQITVHQIYEHRNHLGQSRGRRPQD